MITLRILTALVGVVYAALSIATYSQLSYRWEYLGFWYQPPSIWETSVTVVLTGLLGMLLPVKEWTPTAFIKWVLYFVLITPALIIPPQQGALPRDILLTLFALIFLSSAFLFVFVKDGRPFRTIFITPRVLEWGVLMLWGAGTLAIFYVFWGQMQLVGLEDVYTQRDAADSISSSAIVYVMGVMSGAVNPYLIVTGILKRRPWLIAAGVFGQIVIYSTLAGKIVIGSMLLTVGVLFAFRNGRVIFSRVFAAVSVFGALGPALAISAPGGLAATLSSLIYMRILILPGVLVGVYTEFFSRYPVTYFSHSLVGRLFYEYPYGSASVGQVVGYYVTPVAGDDVNNYVANFIAGDGIAGFGVWGVPIIFGITGLWMWILAKCAGKLDQRLTCGMLMSSTTALANSSLFTTILTGGGAALALLLYLHRSAEETEAAGLRQQTDKLSPPGAASRIL
jgi:hypothetical protein